MSNKTTPPRTEPHPAPQKKTRWLRRVLWTLFLVPLTLLLVGTLYQAISMKKDSMKFPPPGDMVDIGGHRLHIQAAGQGSPVVVLEAGAGGNSLDWSHVQPALAKITRVCAYDRAGLGWSESGSAPRTAQQIVDELHELLSKHGEKPPYLLVGHSFGGMVTKLFAASYPDEVAGMVLVDAIHEDFFSRMPPQVKEGTAAQLKMLTIGRYLSVIGLPRLLMPPLAAQGLPPEVQPASNALGFRPKIYKTVHDEAQNFETNAVQVRERKLPRKDLPLTVLSRGKATQWPPNVDPAEAERVWADLQTEHVSLSTRAKQIIVEESGHYIQIEEPQVVIQAITDMLDELKKSTSPPAT